MWEILQRNLKTLKTTDIYLSNFSVGLSFSLLGPCLLDLQRMIATDAEHIALIYTSESVGFLVGSIVGGIILDITSSKFLILTACNFLFTVTMFGIPWSRSVNILLSLAVLNGISSGVIETGAIVVCIELRGSGPYLQALHFSFGLASLISPLIAEPFLEYQKDVPFSNNSSNFSNIKNFSSNIQNTLKEIPKVTYPFSIVGIICLIVTVLYFVTYLVSPTDDHVSSTAKEDNSDISWLFLSSTIIFSFLVLFVVFGCEIGFGQILTAYVVKGSLHATASLGSFMTSVYWASFTIMRLISIFLSMRISNVTMLITDLVLIAVSGILLVFFMPNQWALWVACITFGAGVAPLYATLIAWVDDYIVITNKISAIFTVACAVGDMVICFIIAYLIDTIPEMFAYMTASTSISTAVLLLILYGIFKNGKKKIKKTKESENHIENMERF